jgi:hypothetical protein
MVRGDAANNELRELIKDIANTQSIRVRDSEPLSQWEDLREITGCRPWRSGTTPRTSP